MRSLKRITQLKQIEETLCLDSSQYTVCLELLYESSPAGCFPKTWHLIISITSILDLIRIFKATVAMLHCPCTTLSSYFSFSKESTVSGIPGGPKWAILVQNLPAGRVGIEQLKMIRIWTKTITPVWWSIRHWLVGVYNGTIGAVCLFVFLRYQTLVARELIMKSEPLVVCLRPCH